MERKRRDVKKIISGIWGGGMLIGLGIIFLPGLDWAYMLILVGVLIIVTSIIKYLFPGEEREEKKSSF